MEALEKVLDLKYEEVLAKVKAGFSEYQVALDEFQLYISNYLKSELSAMQQKIEAIASAINKRMDTLEARLDYSVMTDETLAAKKQALSSQLASIAEQIAETETSLHSAEANGSDTTLLTSRLATLTNEYQSVKSDLDNVEYVIKIRESSELALQRQWINELQELCAGYEAKFRSLTEKDVEQDARLDALEKQLAKLQASYDAFVKTVNEKFSQLEDLPDALATLQAEINGLSDSVKSVASGTNAYTIGGSSSAASSVSNAGGTSNVYEDKRDLRTDATSSLSF